MYPLPYILCEDASHHDLLPFTFTRPLWALRAGIFTQLERWRRASDRPAGTWAYGYLQGRFSQWPSAEEALWVNGKFWPEPELLRLLDAAEPQTGYLNPEGELLLARMRLSQLPARAEGLLSEALLTEMGVALQKTEVAPRAFRFPTDLYRLNAEAIAFDFELITRSEASRSLHDPHTRVYGADNLFISPGVRTWGALINAEDGPVYLGPGVEVGEGAIIRGRHAFGAHTQVSMGAKLRGDSAFGPYVKVGGEVGNSVIMGYSNKGHEGYLGNSVLGYWCNLGADTNTSNLKNNYTPIKLWHYPSARFRETGLQFCGLMMGDHSKCGINTMFNTGTVVGVSANIFGSGFPRTFIPSFAWGGAAGFSTFRLEKAYEVAERAMNRRKLTLSEGERQILAQVFAQTATYRRWEKK